MFSKHSGAVKICDEIIFNFYLRLLYVIHKTFFNVCMFCPICIKVCIGMYFLPTPS